MSEIKFYSHHLPALQDGEYEIAVTQTVTTNNLNESFSAETLTLYVNGPRFQLAPSEIHRVFPQEGAKGDFEGILPSISFSRSTLLWERDPSEVNKLNAPWLYLLLVDESEAGLIVEKEYKFDGENFKYPSPEDPTKDLMVSPEDLGVIVQGDRQFISTKIPISFIDLSGFTTKVIPATLDELQYLGYTRIKTGTDQSEEHSVVVGNRLPKPGSSSTVYLISLENKYKADRTLDDSRKFFPVLYKWKFYTNDDQLYSIQPNIGKINADTDCNTLSEDVKNNAEIFGSTEDFKNYLVENGVAEPILKKMLRFRKLPGGSFHDVMSNLSNGITPLTLPNKDAGIERSGSVQLPFEKGTKGKIKTTAWYRGPLTTQNIVLNQAITNKTGKLPLFVDPNNGFIPDSADDLMFTYKDVTDASYAAAYELGQLTALNDTAFSSAFFEWKHQAAAAKVSKKLSQKALSSNGQKFPLFHHLPLKSTYETALGMPQPIIDKFDNWKLLRGIPIRYLVPDPTMVPSECIRYFKVDNHWINAFIMGAFSIGHTARVDFSEEIKPLFSDQSISGFFLNSIAVSVWHDYELDCKTNLSKNATPLRKTNLDVFTHIYLFKGQIAELNFHLHPGKLHPGFLVEKTEKGVTYHKKPKEVDVNVTDSINGETRVIDILKLKAQLSSPSVAEFNGKLMEGTPDVKFTIA
jgi:hypothetical protein